MKYVSQWVIIVLIASFLFSTFGVSAESKKMTDTNISIPKNLDISLSGSDLFEKGKNCALSYIESKKR